MTLRCAWLVTVPISAPRSMGSRAPQTMGTGCGPCVRGCDVSTIAFGCFFLGPVVVTCRPPRSRHPVGVGGERPFGRDLLQVAPELDAGGPRHVALPELGALRAPERERIARHGDADVDAHHAARRALCDIAGDGAAAREDAEGVAVLALSLEGEGLVEGVDVNHRQNRPE